MVFQFQYDLLMYGKFNLKSNRQPNWIPKWDDKEIVYPWGHYDKAGQKLAK